MDKKNIFIVGGSSGIGLELVKVLSENHHEIYVGSRTADTLAGIPGVHHLALDIKAELLDLETLPKTLQGLVSARARSCLNHFSA